MSAGVFKTSHNNNDPWQLKRVLQRARDPALNPQRVADVDAGTTDLATATDRLIVLRARPDPEGLAIVSAVASEQARLGRKTAARPAVGPPARAASQGYRPVPPAAARDESVSQPTSDEPEDPVLVADMDSAWRALGRIRDELTAQATPDLVLRISRTPRRVARLLA